MFSRFGLRSRMAVSYVLVSAAAVLVVEAFLLAIMVPRIRSASDSIEQAQQRALQAETGARRIKIEGLALQIAVAAGIEASALAAQEPGRSEEALLLDVAANSFGGTPDPLPSGDGATIAPTPELVQVLATVDGQVVASEPSNVLARNSPLPAAAIGLRPNSGQTEVNGRVADWATRPVEIAGRAGSGRRVIGIAYATHLTPLKGVLGRESASTGAPVSKGGPASTEGRPPVDEEPAAVADTSIGSLIVPGAIILILLLPVGGLFGLLSTGPLIRRIRRLARGTSAMANGDLKARIPVSGGDEVGRLEQAFNSMAERLDTAVQVQRKAAGSEARRAERTRIARELHDSISQDLFSASLVAGGLRKALPASSELRRQAESMELSLARMMREMRAMLLELRPIALEDAGLAEALDELCRAYEVRLGISISSRIDSLRLGAPVEHAVLRVVQEALGNAVRHGEPDAIELRVAETDGRVTVTVHDDGRGFDSVKTAGRHGMGLKLMRERVGELGGTVEVVSAPEQGTTVKVLLPVGVE
ncbi:ATP-binding protein [Plantactinospora solaniradicis]|uniref:Oxygen sensor histidine kinase NreB n=1 Tax=Plantactinospora solaniradicis TaxID=1723736 RepID=A0ABW1K387_9ACTN